MVAIGSILRKKKGFAAVEMTLVAPLFLLLIIGVVDITQAIQANHIIISMSREGGNIVSRSSNEPPQAIMDIISSTSGDLDLTSDGVIYITEIVGRSGDDPYIKSQYKWNQGGLDKNSSIWSNCNTWALDGGCTDIDINTPTALTNLPINLDDGEIVYGVEVFYRYAPIFGYLLNDEYLLSDTTYM